MIELKDSEGTDTFLTVCLLLITSISWLLWIWIMWGSVSTLVSAKSYSALTEISHNALLEPAVALATFLLLPINLFLTLLCYLRLPFEIKIIRR